MVTLRLMAALVVMLPISIAHATTADDTYGSGYAAGLLKQNLKLDMPYSIVKDTVIAFPTGSLEAANQA